MDYDSGIIMQKTADWSLLNDGMTIPALACALLKAWDDSILTHGAGNDIKVLIDGELYDAKLKNHHHIIHKNNPTFHCKKFQFEFANDEVLRLKLHEYLMV